MNVLLAALLSLSPMVTGNVPDQTPLQKFAAKLADSPQGVPQWKMDLVLAAIQRGATGTALARRTTFCPRCDSSGVGCDGSRSRIGTCAASKNIPLHSIVWLERGGLLLVTDRGGAVKVHRGKSADFDQWLPSCVGDCWRGPGTVSTRWAMVLVGDGRQGRNSGRHPVNAFERALGNGKK